jgi:hypothetical protein
MSGAHEVDCSGCGLRHTLSVEQARKQRVVRCDCGQFVRMDRALAELRSEPAPAPVALADADQVDEQTHMLSSLAAVAALGNTARARDTQASVTGDERKSQPAPRPPMPSLSGALWPSSAPGEKPLWYVDLGGSETVEMTIEQLIIARRSGKLGEGALVWRAGMPRWRPVGSLIPAASRPTPTPPPPISPATVPSRLPPPPALPPVPLARQPEPTPEALGSYERPLATLEFALEKPLSAAPRATARPLAAPPTPPRRASEPPRAPTPLPALGLRRAVSVLTPVPPPITRVSVSAAPVPPPITSSSVSAAPVTLPPSGPRPSQPPGQRPRWMTAALALLLCVTASGSGAFLVRSLRAHHQPLVLTPSNETQAAASGPAAVEAKPTSTVAPEPTSSTRVVDINSLSVERAAPRAVWHAAAVVPKAAPAPATDDEGTTNTTSATSADSADSDPPAIPPSASAKPKNSDLPAAAHVNPYATGTQDEAAQ